MVRNNIILSYVFYFLATCATGFPNYDYFFHFKVILLVFSFFIILNTLDFKKITYSKNLILYSFYSIYLSLCIYEFDTFSQRILFNSIVIIISTYAALLIPITKNIKYFIFYITIIFFTYALFFNINVVDGKPQVHAQTFLLIFISYILFYKENPKKTLTSIFILVLISKVRSAFAGIFPLPLYIFYKNNTYLFLVSISISFLIFAAISLNINYLSTLFGSHALDSMSWRLYHWKHIFIGFEFYDYIFGKGIGYSWRMTLALDTFYSDGINYIATHNNYVKIIADTGLVGLLIFSILIFRIYKNADTVMKPLIVFYLGYSFYDEGIWLFSLLWIFIILYTKKEKF